MSIKNSIPNFVTCCSLMSGCIACIMALRGNLPMATLWIVIASVFDFGDGFAARSLHAYSPMGKELDSLSDMVSFGVAPGMIVYWLLEQACMTAPVLGEAAGYVPYMALVIPVFSGLRLAKFNIDERQTTSFIGMPVPGPCSFLGVYRVCVSFCRTSGQHRVYCRNNSCGNLVFVFAGV